MESNQKKLRRQLLRMGYPPYRIMKAVKEHHTLEECVQFLDEQRLSSAAKPVGPTPERRLGALRAQLIRQGYSRGYINMALKRHNTLEGALIYLKNVMSKRQEVYESLRGDGGDKSLTRIKSIRALYHDQNLLIFRKECLFRQICYLWEDRLDRMESIIGRLGKALEQCENPNLCTCLECVPTKRRKMSLTHSENESKHSYDEHKHDYDYPEDEVKSFGSSSDVGSGVESTNPTENNFVPPERERYDSGPDRYESGPDRYDSMSEKSDGETNLTDIRSDRSDLMSDETSEVKDDGSEYSGSNLS